MSERTVKERMEEFHEQFKAEIMRLSAETNFQGDASMQDGFSTEQIAAGWITYKGLSLGFSMTEDPVSIVLTFGGSYPFVGHVQTFAAHDDGLSITWQDASDNSTCFANLHDLASYALERLAAKAHDQFPSLHPAESECPIF